MCIRDRITIWPYDDDTQLPGGKLVPRAGDTYILWNIRMPDEYYRLAEELSLIHIFPWSCVMAVKPPAFALWLVPPASVLS